MNVNGFDDENVVMEINEAIKSDVLHFSESVWKCQVCMCVPRRPTYLKSCGHIGCEACLRKVIVTHNNKDLEFGTAQCPTCRALFDNFSFTPYEEWALALQQTWKCIRVRCGFHSCSFTSDPIAVVEHERALCEYRIIECPSSRCHFRASVAQVRAHAVTCEKVYVHCLKCGFPVRYITEKNHDCVTMMTEHIAGMSHEVN